MYKILTSVWRLTLEIDVKLHPLMLGSTSSSPSSRQKPAGNNRSRAAFFFIHPHALNALHIQGYGLHAPSSKCTHHRGSLTSHVGVGAVKLTVFLHPLLFLSFAASVESLWGAEIHYAVQLGHYVAQLTMFATALWSNKRFNLGSKMEKQSVALRYLPSLKWLVLIFFSGGGSFSSSQRPW